jgi:hypothetical protein
MGWRSPTRIIIAVIALVVLVVGVATWLLIRFDLMPDTNAGSMHATAADGTRVVVVIAVDATGQPASDFRQVPAAAGPGSVAEVSGCAASPAAVADDVYYCAPNAAGADVCWPSTPGSLLCLHDPWDKGLHRVTYTPPLPHVKPPAEPEPFALLLDDGTQCRLRNGGAWGGRDDGLVGAYGCPNANLAVLVPQQRQQGDASPIDRSQPRWTVRIGSLGAADSHLPPPQTHSVKTAWFAGS